MTIIKTNDMNKIRKGNTIDFSFSVYRVTGDNNQREPEDLTGIDLQVEFKNKLYGNLLEVSHSIKTNRVEIRIPGIPHLKSGIYNFALGYTKEGRNFAIDVDAFCIVDSSLNTTASVNCCPDLEIDTIELSGEVGFGASSGQIEQVQSDWLEINTDLKSYIKNKPPFNKVATTGSYNDLSDTPTIPVVPEGIVTDPNYVHTDNNFTTLLLDKLKLLSNYDDALLKVSVQEEINRATLSESELDDSIKKVASDLSLFITGEPDSNNIIDKWREVVDFLASISNADDKNLAQILLELKSEINNNVVQTLLSYYTKKQVDDTFVKKVLDSRLISKDEIDKLAGLFNYDDTEIATLVTTKASKIPIVEQTLFTVTLKPNTFNRWQYDITENLNILLEGVHLTKEYEEFMFQFTTGPVAIELLLVNNLGYQLKWVGEKLTTLEKNTTYQFSVMNWVVINVSFL